MDDEKLKTEFLLNVVEVNHDLKVMFSSSHNEMVKHPAFIRILKMGMKAVPWLFEELENDKGWLPLVALVRILPKSEQPFIVDSVQGRYDKLCHIWLTWGKKKGFY